MNLRTCCALSSVAFATAALAACARHPAAELRLALRDPVASLDPQIVDDRPTFYALGNVYEPLATHDPGGNIVPALATAWSNPDERTWRFDLRRGVTFHDGRTLTARDVRYTLERARTHPQSWLREDLADIASVGAPGDHVVEVRTRGASPLLLQSLARALIVPEGWAEASAGANGTGPYQVESWRPELTRLRSFARYWRGPPRWTAVEVRTVPQADARVDALSRGEADLIDFPPPSFLPSPGARVRLLEASAARVAILGFRVGGAPRNPFADQRVRDAMALAVDPPALVRQILASRGEPASQLSPPGVFGYVPDLPLSPHDPEAARAALQTSRSREVVRAELLCSPGGRLLAEAVAAQVGPIGVELTPRVLSREEFDRRLNAHQADAYVLHLTYPELDSTRVLVSGFHTVRPEGRRGALNFSGHSDPELDALLERAEAEFDPQARHELIAQATRRVLASHIWLPLYVQHDTYAARGLRFEGGLVPGIAFERVVRE